MLKIFKNRTAFSLVTFAIILLTAAAAIFWARGFKPDFKTGRIDRTGLIVATSVPTGAQVYLNDRLTSATDTNIAFLDPGTYKVKIEKDGYTTWEKEIEVKADLATEINALLFPTAPQISPLTTTGAGNPALSPDSSALVYGTSGPRGGVYLLSLSERPFSFRQESRLLAKNTVAPALDFAKAEFIWEPNSKQVIAIFKNDKGETTSNILLDTSKSDQQVQDITGSLNATLAGWQDIINTRSQTQAITVPENIKSATSEAVFAKNPTPSPTPTPAKSQSTPSPIPQQSASLLTYYPTGLIFSPNEEKVLYKTSDGKYKVFDIKKKKESTLPDLPDLMNISWYPDSEHLVVAQKDLISVIETDGQNKMGIYSGKYENGFVFAHPSASRIIILTTLTQQEGTPPNLYAINLK